MRLTRSNPMQRLCVETGRAHRRVLVCGEIAVQWPLDPNTGPSKQRLSRRKAHLAADTGREGDCRATARSQRDTCPPGKHEASDAARRPYLRRWPNAETILGAADINVRATTPPLGNALLARHRNHAPCRIALLLAAPGRHLVEHGPQALADGSQAVLDARRHFRKYSAAY